MRLFQDRLQFFNGAGDLRVTHVDMCQKEEEMQEKLGLWTDSF